ncbi:MAG: AGE family epimerase/isomerase [Gemmatimonadota bacterium]|nr:AGE family epimerase/isomerase [Gemmatimonadota bacterium]
MVAEISNIEITKLFRRCVDRCLPFWKRYGVDHEHGGFFGDVLADGSLGVDHKGGWYQGFGIWLFSYFHNRYSDGEEYLDAARRGWFFIRDHARDADGRWAMNLSRTGDVLEGATSVLTEAYLAHGLVELFRATSDSSHLDVAREACLNIRERVQDPNFRASAPAYTEPHSLNGAWANVLPAVTDYLRERPNDSRLTDMADLGLYTLFEKHLDPSTGLIVEAVAPDGTPYTGSQRGLIKPGAAAETCTAIMMEADRRNDRDLRRKGVDLLERHFEAGWDRQYGGIFYEIDLDGQPTEDRKDAWTQAEFMRAFVTATVTEADDWIAETYAQIHSWAFDKYADNPDDLWRISVTRDGKPIYNRRLDMVHHPRMLLSILENLERRDRTLNQ